MLCFLCSSIHIKNMLGPDKTDRWRTWQEVENSKLGSLQAIQWLLFPWVWHWHILGFLLSLLGNFGYKCCLLHCAVCYLTFSAFSFYCFFVDFTHVSQSHLSPHPLKPALCPWNLPPKIKQSLKENQNPQTKTNQITTTKEKTLIVEAVVWPIDLHGLFTL